MELIFTMLKIKSCIFILLVFLFSLLCFDIIAFADKNGGNEKNEKEDNYINEFNSDAFKNSGGDKETYDDSKDEIEPLVTKSVFTPSLFRGLVLKDENSKGVTILDVMSKTPMFKAGLQYGDVLVEIDGEKINTLEDYFVATKKVRANNIDNIKLVIGRKQKLLRKKVKELKN